MPTSLGSLCSEIVVLGMGKKERKKEMYWKEGMNGNGLGTEIAMPWRPADGKWDGRSVILYCSV